MKNGYLPWILGECILVSKALFHVMVTVAIRSRVDGWGRVVGFGVEGLPRARPFLGRLYQKRPSPKNC